ncbi:hypothetical protein C7451_103124 [Blastomonas natatoria]|uniref:Uncharacterized protein n=1 Tax=Blastomonas natatoria TaxID=34015 RepID=A0A2V3V8B2_9SPHN|nr:hypothetical protein [Blastomonas natatoria]PXW78016.1 hypothetical protein C7451_103124 [Blastomonas natatoria]
MTDNPNTGKDAPESPAATDAADKRKGGGLVPDDSRNVTGTAAVEDGRWTGAAVFPEEGPKVPKPKE